MHRQHFVRDIVSGTTVLASVTSLDTPGDGPNAPSLSRDGRFVAFSSQSSDLVTEDAGYTLRPHRR